MELGEAKKGNYEKIKIGSCGGVGDDWNLMMKLASKKLSHTNIFGKKKNNEAVTQLIFLELLTLIKLILRFNISTKCTNFKDIMYY